MNLPYEESLKLLQNTGKTVELIVSQIFNKYQQKLEQQQQRFNKTEIENNECSNAANKSFEKYHKNTGDNMRSENKNVAIYLENSVSSSIKSSGSHYTISSNKNNRDTDKDNKYIYKTGGDDNTTKNDAFATTTGNNASATIKNDAVFLVAAPSAHRNIEYNGDYDDDDAEKKFILRNGNGIHTSGSNKHTFRKTKTTTTTTTINNDISFNSCRKKTDDSYLLSAKSMPDLPKVCVLLV